MVASSTKEGLDSPARSELAGTSTLRIAVPFVGPSNFFLFLLLDLSLSPSSFAACIVAWQVVVYWGRLHRYLQIPLAWQDNLWLS